MSSINFLIIDDDKSIRLLLKNQLLKKYPDAQVELYDPNEQGIPNHKYDWEKHDIVLLDYDLGMKYYTGLDWLKRIKHLDNPPLVIMVTGQGSQKLAVDAIKSGADNYLPKYDVVTNKLHEIIDETIALNKNTEKFIQKYNKSSKIKNNKVDILLAKDSNVYEYYIDGYDYLAIITQSSTTTIFAERKSDAKQVVIKIQKILDYNQKAVIRFKKEIEILSKIDHPNIIKILEFGATQTYAYYVMPFFKKGDLASHIKEIALDKSTATKLMIDLIHGIAELHKHGIIHRDLKPHNILRNDDDTLVIADLGVAKDLLTAGEITMKGELLGTPYYMSPEQFTDMDIDYRSDIYSLGVIFYELLTGKLPYTGETLMEIVYNQSYEGMPSLNEDLKQYENIIFKMIEKNRENRYQSVSEILTDIEQIDNNC